MAGIHVPVHHRYRRRRLEGQRGHARSRPADRGDGLAAWAGTRARGGGCLRVPPRRIGYRGGPSGNRLGRVLDGTPADRFYRTLGQLADMLAGPRVLRECRAADGWPGQGVYFFFEPGEVRADGRDRVVRVGTHALTATSQAT